MEERIGKVLLNYDYYGGSDLYSDGAIEDELLEIATNYDEDQFNKIIGTRKKWPLLYHLSDIRENVLNWYPIKDTDSVLEIGSGCGAITGVLSRKAKKVTCIELSKKRSMINANRHKNCDNVKIMVGNFETIQNNLEDKYDIITLIGVLEYADSYINDDNPYVHFLEMIKKHLNPGGKVIIAIENKFGLKYFAGCKEDHVGIYYEGIEGYHASTGVKTFTKKEISEISNEAGYSKLDFYYPYPDYKFAHTIYSDKYLPKKGELVNNIRNFDTDRLITFNEGKVFDSIIENGEFPMFSNSFILVLQEG